MTVNLDKLKQQINEAIVEGKRLKEWNEQQDRNYVDQLVQKFLRKLPELVKECASKGNEYVYYFFDISTTDQNVRDKALSCIAASKAVEVCRELGLESELFSERKLKIKWDVMRNVMQNDLHEREMAVRNA